MIPALATTLRTSPVDLFVHAFRQEDCDPTKRQHQQPLPNISSTCEPQEQSLELRVPRHSTSGPRSARKKRKQLASICHTYPSETILHPLLLRTHQPLRKKPRSLKDRLESRGSL